MKTLVILRHAKAQPDAPAGDWARELTARGLRDAAAMGTHVQGLVGTPDAIVTSDARRAQQTAELAAEATGFTPPLTLEPRIYGADLATLLRLVRRLPEEAEHVLLVGHNPGFEELAAALANAGTAVDRLPTAGLAHLEFAATRWDEVRPGSGHLRELATPKTIA
jgi:phosphohistidine phosphatase